MRRLWKQELGRGSFHDYKDSPTHAYWLPPTDWRADYIPAYVDVGAGKVDRVAVRTLSPNCPLSRLAADPITLRPLGVE